MALQLAYAWCLLARSRLDTQPLISTIPQLMCLLFPSQSYVQLLSMKVYSIFNKCAVKHPDSPLDHISCHPFYALPHQTGPWQEPIFS